MLSIATIGKSDSVIWNKGIYFRQAFKLETLREQPYCKVSFQSHVRRWHVEQGLVAKALATRAFAPAFLQVGPDGHGFRLCQRVQQPRLRCAEKGSRGADDGLSGLVAGGLRPLWAAVHPNGVA